MFVYLYFFFGLFLFCLHLFYVYLWKYVCTYIHMYVCYCYIWWLCFFLYCRCCCKCLFVCLLCWYWLVTGYWTFLFSNVYILLFLPGFFVLYDFFFLKRKMFVFVMVSYKRILPLYGSCFFFFVAQKPVATIFLHIKVCFVFNPLIFLPLKPAEI